ncbi:hypothetical protein PRIPAC_90894 [Pristionchus pacificus]|uniref:Uncharacterized protein n=1 Tax=Pristionchus pacificus TaxID=54126 RepID=A0A2A6B623_PRIPA|nr:hypothetical protein PRIPAC_90894 [Pristionchus pacificus]|eukprot:PDM61322.1 hypothetical protein PRIPAC_50764 [Pristionchus pacificus]
MRLSDDCMRWEGTSMEVAADEAKTDENGGPVVTVENCPAYETDLLVKLKDGWMNWKRKDEGKRGRGL